MSARLSSGGKGEVVEGVKVGVEAAAEAEVLITGVEVVEGDPVVGLGLDAVLVVEVVGLVVVVVCSSGCCVITVMFLSVSADKCLTSSV